MPPRTKENVPAGRPDLSTARVIARATSVPVTGWAGWPFTTTGHPAASAEAVSPPAVEKASGKLLAPKTATGPSGTIRWRMSARGSGVAVRQRGVDPDPEVVALPDDAGEHPQLARRTSDLARDAALGQPALADRLDDDRVLVGLDLGRDRLEERAALLGGRGAVGAERLGRGRGGGGDIGLLGVRARDDGGGGCVGS